MIDSAGTPIPGIYATGWIKRGPVGLIGHTKADAIETIGHLLSDRATWWQPDRPDESEIEQTLRARGVKYVDWKAWLKIDAAELASGARSGRERIKLFDRQEMIDIGSGS